MVRYLEVITGEMQRMRVARRSRGYDPRWMWQARAVATSAGTLFIRSYERGERVLPGDGVAGLQGSLPVLADEGAPARQWAISLALPAAAAAIALLGWRPDRERCVGVTHHLLEVEDLAFAYPDGRQALFGVDLIVAPASGLPSSARTAPERPRSSCT